MIPFSPPDIREEDIAAVVDVLRSGWITTGPKGQEFCEGLTALAGAEGTVLMSSATTGMEAILRLLGIGPGDEVITSAYTYTASASVIAHVGADIVLVDTEPGEFTPSPERFAAAVTERTKAIIAVDLGGVPYDAAALRAALAPVADRFRPGSEWQRELGGVAIIADAAHSLGGMRDGVRAGQLADFSSFSFHAVKNLTTAEGGAVTWRRGLPFEAAEVRRRLLLQSLHGQSKDALAKTKAGSWEYDIELLGHKSNLPDVLAVLGLSQLGRYEATMARRLDIIRAFDAGIAPTGAWSLVHEGESFRSSGHLYLAQLPGDDIEAVRARRNELIQRMAAAGVATNVHYKPLPLLSAYRGLGFDIADFPNAYAQYCRVLSLPLHTKLTDDDVRTVIDVFVAELGALGPVTA